MQITLTRVYDLACAHKLVVGPEKCKRLHGHNYQVEVEVRRKNLEHPLEDGFVIDAGDLDITVARVMYGAKGLDHRHLNTLMEEWGWDAATQEAAPTSLRNLCTQPSAENLGIYLWERLGYLSKGTLHLVSLRIFEEKTLWTTVHE